jgi:hypothetical protein
VSHPVGGTQYSVVPFSPCVPKSQSPFESKEKSCSFLLVHRQSGKVSLSVPTLCGLGTYLFLAKEARTLVLSLFLFRGKIRQKIENIEECGNRRFRGLEFRRCLLVLCASESLQVLVPLLHSSELHSRHRRGGGAIVALAEVRQRGYCAVARAVFEWAVPRLVR